MSKVCLTPPPPPPPVHVLYILRPNTDRSELMEEEKNRLKQNSFAFIQSHEDQCNKILFCHFPGVACMPAIRKKKPAF
ncbi:hypothetical protein DERF_014355 [Dermatophagoides farinae]|uniref:Uncharacterized protein n=1 Tax=Dermatophagoides farinae TaxID=6954 RepID=A0A922KU61_DERFA|nr:hypothetical protein DERF_014355 [Dermatophagoides farinae]